MYKNKNLLFIIITFGILISLFSTSIKTTYQVFFLSMSKDFNLNREEFTWSGTLFMSVFGISSPVIGYIADRIGAKKTIILGIFFSGIVFLLMAVVKNFYLFVIIYGFGAAFTYTAISYVSLGTLIDEIDTPKIKSLVYALVTNGAALGFVFLAPLWLHLEKSLNWREIYMLLGIFFTIPLTFLSIYVTRITNVAGASKQKHQGISEKTLPTRLKNVFGNRNFYYLAFGFFGCGVSMAYIDIHLISQLKDLKFTENFISISMIILGVTEFIGGLFAGYLCDRYSKKLILSAFYILRAIAVFILFSSSSHIGVILFTTIFGLSYMGTVIGTSMISLSIFDKEIKGFAFGFIWLFHQFGAVLATQLGATLFDISGNYQAVLFLTGSIAVLSSLLVLRIKTDDHGPNKKRIQQPI